MKPLREQFKGPLDLAGGFTWEKGNAAIADGREDFIAFGLLFMANPTFRIVCAPTLLWTNLTVQPFGAETVADMWATRRSSSLTEVVRIIGVWMQET